AAGPGHVVRSCPPQSQLGGAVGSCPRVRPRTHGADAGGRTDCLRVRELACDRPDAPLPRAPAASAHRAPRDAVPPAVRPVRRPPQSPELVVVAVVGSARRIGRGAYSSAGRIAGLGGAYPASGPG